MTTTTRLLPTGCCSSWACRRIRPPTRLPCAWRHNACKQGLTTTETVAFSAYLAGVEARIIDVKSSDFAAVTAALTQRSLAAVRRALRDAQITRDEVQGVVLVGGSTRMPQVREAVADFLAASPTTNLNPDEVVALGAAIQANQLAGNSTSEGLLLLDVIRCPWGWRPWAAWSSASWRATKPFHRQGPRTSLPTRTGRRPWPSMWCRANATWCRTAAAWRGF